MTSYILCNHRYDLGTPIFLGLVGCFLIFVGAVFYGVTVCQVIFSERYINSSNFSYFPVIAELLTLAHFGLAVKWFMPMEDVHTWPLAPEEEPCIPDTTNPMDLTTWPPDDPAAPRSQIFQRQHQQKCQREMHLCNNFKIQHKKT